ncbi:hypothetical protein J2Z69_002408 [Paenibacillus shirakamiensis]|uniref:MacB-like periplasmic core domain-containing protein n=1 Tax=Paenibacillus shirakamiensis TaxID=1265935 RepID=A0ABS4JI25_9BACL|nr:hypothetical protein [Paenibacillus shirakamiensis]MBP2001365.1 hypothetical protein [Paenibacillus shirakamiensis]
MFTLKRKDIIFIFIFLSLLTLCYCFLTYTGKQEKFQELSNELYTPQHVVLSTKDYKENFISNISQPNYRLFLEYDDTYRLLLENKGEWSPPMLSGKFFSKSDNTKKAVIGKELEKNTKEIKGKKYISAHGEIYEVTGTMGASFASSIDYIALLNKPIKGPAGDYTKIVVDGSSKKNINLITNEIIKKNPSFNVLEDEQKGLTKTADIPFIYQLLVFEFYLLILISIIAFMRYWYEKEKKLMYVLFILGISKKKVYTQSFLKIIMNITVSGILSMILFFTFDAEAIITLAQMIWVMSLFLFIACIILGVFLWLNNSNRGVAKQ